MSEPRIMAVATLALLAGCSKEPEQVGYLEAMYSVRELLNESDYIVEGVLAEADWDQRTFAIKIQKSLKGERPSPTLRMNLKSGIDNNSEAIKKHFVAGAPVLFFSNGSAGQLYLNRFFLCFYSDELQKGGWNLSTIEVQMNRTFNGAVQDFSSLVEKILSGRTISPPPNPNLKPIDAAALKALPSWGETVDEDYLPPPFRKLPTPPVVPFSPQLLATVAPGLRWMSFEGDWTEPPQFDHLVASGMGVTPYFDLSGFEDQDSLRLRFKGYIDIPKDGDYAFYLSSDAESLSSLSINGIELARTFRNAKVRKESGGEIALKAGKHAITVTYAGTGDSPRIQISWFGPDLAKRPLPAKVLFHEP